MRALAALLVTGAAVVVPTTDGKATVISVQGESPVRTTMSRAADPRAAGGRYLALDTVDSPPEQGWYAEYRIDVGVAGSYRLDAVATPPIETAGSTDDSEVGSFFSLSVNDGPPTPVARSQPHWYESAGAWGDLRVLRLGDVELRRGTNTVRFLVDRRAILSDSARYRFLLDHFKLTPVPIALTSVGPGIFRAGEPVRMRFGLNGHASTARRVEYRVTDYFGARVASGSVTIPAGADGINLELPALPAGNYRVTASTLTGNFAVLPERRPVTGPANRFGVNAFVFSLVPPSRLDAFATAMKQMGAEYVRDGDSWPVAEPARGRYDKSEYNQVTATLHRHGLKTLEVVSAAPDWALTPESVPLAADLRDAYNYANHLASGGSESDAIQLSNEPDVDDTSSTGDQHAAYVKAAALGIADASRPPVTVLPGIAVAGHFQELMLQNEVVRYADAWGFHSYPDPAEEDPDFPGSEEQHALHRLHGARTPLWMTESGVFLPADKGRDLTVERQATQARYLVRSSVEDLATGTDRHFWFGGPPIHDDGVYFGLLSREFQPLPAYSAHAAMTSLLGRADFVTRVRGLPSYAAGFVFADRDRSITVLWSARTKRLTVPVRGSRVEVYDIMGRLRQVTTGGAVRVQVGPDPVYLVSDRPGLGSRPVRVRREHSAAEHIVLSQRFSASNSAPGKDNGDAEPPLGYRLGATNRMHLDVYNFGRTARTVTVTGHGYGGWAVRPVGAATVRVPAKGRVAVPFAIASGRGVRPGVDYPLVFEATTHGERVTPSVSRIHRRAAKPGQPIPLAPAISVVSRGPELKARVTDALSGVDPDRVEVQVDGRPIASCFDPRTGRLSARLPRGSEIWIRVYNKAHAPTAVSLAVASFPSRGR